ncbi:M13 family metallopeptidase [Nocardia sp. CS682]|uniref:M13 family metallopeptidase n=1 Tax=Nocardia sp. CS682 TaxID=1047172 RepID=UPI001074A0AC|nr:M13 family metallopeptidase [Nocardia sp. CS682]QBS46187.1 endothelin-converting protein [Nocardia sp. CS682]
MRHATSTRFDRRTLLIALAAIPVSVTLMTGCSGRPQNGSGSDLEEVDTMVRPQDDLYRHINGRWLREYQLPPDKSAYGTGFEVADRVQQQLEAIIDTIRDPAPGSDQQKIRDFYDACLDTEAAERLGLTPIADLLGSIDGAATKGDLARVMASIALELPYDNALAACSLFAMVVFPDSKDSATYRPQLGQAGLRFKASFYQSPAMADQRSAYRVFLEKIARSAGFADPSGMARRTFDLEDRIAAAHWDEVRNRDASATYNPRSWQELIEMGPGFEWDSWLAAYSDKPSLFSKIVIAQPSYITSAARLWSEVDIAEWRDYLRLGVVREFAPHLNQEFSDASFDFFERTRGGQTQRPRDEETALATVSTYLDQLLGKEYVGQHFPPASRAHADELIANIVSAYRESFARADWMSQATRDAAIAKLNKLTIKTGYPDTWRDYVELSITAGHRVANIRATMRHEWKQMFAKLGAPVDKFEWKMAPQEVNASYDWNNNAILIPAGMLQPPFFDPDAEPAMNYGGIGAIIGHEIGHGFDDQGSRFDGDGNLRDWWTPADRAAFDERAEALIAQYDSLVPSGLGPEHHVNGALTVGENLADLRGLTMALAAFRRAERSRGNETPDYTNVFLAFARARRAKLRPEQQIRQLAADPHAPNEFRCNQVVRNIDEFYTAFDVKEGDGLFLPPDRRVIL